MRKGQFRPIVPFEAGAAVAINRIIKLGAADDKVVQAAAATDALLGVSDRPAKSGDPIDVCVFGEAPIELGGAVARGDLLTSNADGKAVKAARSPIRSIVVDGAAANTDIAVTGIAVGDELLYAGALDGTAGIQALNLASIQSAGNIRLSVSSAGKKLLVVWRGPAQGVIGRALQAGAPGDIIGALLQPASI